MPCDVEVDFSISDKDQTTIKRDMAMPTETAGNTQGHDQHGAATTSLYGTERRAITVALGIIHTIAMTITCQAQVTVYMEDGVGVT